MDIDAVKSLLGGEHALRNWLILVASMRLLAVVLGYAAPMTLQTRVYNRASKQFTELGARLFAVWTAVTCLVTLFAAFNLDNSAIVLLCIATFFIAIIYLSLELVVYGTVSLSTVATPFFFACEQTLASSATAQPFHHALNSEIAVVLAPLRVCSYVHRVPHVSLSQRYAVIRTRCMQKRGDFLRTNPKTLEIIFSGQYLRASARSCGAFVALSRLWQGA